VPRSCFYLYFQPVFLGNYAKISLENAKVQGVPAMRTQTQHENKILKDINWLPEQFQKKMAEIIRFLKTEFFNGKADEKKATEEFLSVCGIWEDERSIKEQLEDIYSLRKPTNRTEKNF